MPRSWPAAGWEVVMVGEGVQMAGDHLAASLDCRS